MRILVTFASKHGSTRDIAAAIADELRRAGHQADVFAAEAAPDTAAYETAVIGSAIYMGGWMPAARAYVDANQAALRRMPVWLFSSGPLGSEQPQPEGDPTHLPELLAKTGARGHQIFTGSLNQETLSVTERVIVKAVKAPYGDFRDWDGIRGWARAINGQRAAGGGGGDHV